MAQTHILILPFRDLRSLKNLASFLKKKKKTPNNEWKGLFLTTTKLHIHKVRYPNSYIYVMIFVGAE